MKVKFIEGFVTHVPTECLIEDVQMLMNSLYNGNMDALECAIECLCESIERYTESPAGTSIRPSASSIIAMSYGNGILCQPNGEDLLCAAHKPASVALIGGVLQCDESCPYYAKSCRPDKDMILLAEGIPYYYDIGDHSELFDG